MLRTMRSVVLLSCAMTMAVCLGCDEGCPVRDTRHEVVTVTDSPHSTYFSLCVDSGDCQRLCDDAAMARSGPYHSVVDSCRRVVPDGGLDGGSNGESPEVTLEIDYRVFAFCGA